MKNDDPQVPILVRREIEARLADPLVKAFAEELGSEKALAVLSGVIDRLAFENGRQLAERMGGNSLFHFARGLEAWQAGGAYDLEVLELTERSYRFNVTRCSYAQMYRRLNLRELGLILSCQRDFKLVEGFNSALRLTRTRTLLEGAGCCDFTIAPL